MKKLLLLFFVSLQISVQSQNLLWANKYGGSQNDDLNLVTVDSTGNVYTTGSIGTGDAMSLAKYDANGLLLWTDTIAGGYTVDPASIKVDAQGNIYIVGQFSSLVDFNPGAGVFNLGVQNFSQSPYFYFLLKLNTNGGFVFAKQIGGYPNSVCVDANNNVFITGTFSNSQDFDPNPLVTNTQTSFDGYSLFITKLDNLGLFVWNKVIGKTTVSTGGFGTAGGKLIMNDAQGNIVLTGYFTDDIDFDPSASVSSYTAAAQQNGHISNPFTLKMDQSGALLWVKFFETYQNSSPTGMAIDGSGNIYTTGVIQGQMDFDSGPGTLYLYHSYLLIPFISKMDANGTIIWAKENFKSNNAVSTGGLAVDNAGNVYTQGRFNSTVSYTTTTGTGTITSTPSSFNTYISTLNSGGNLVSINHIGSTTSGHTIGDGFVLSKNNLYLSGNFSNTVDFDFSALTQTITANGLKDNFIAKYSISSQVGINELINKTILFTIYPNPTNSVINVECLMFNKDVTTITITDVLGKTHLSKTITDNNTQLNVSDFAKGIYFVTLTSSNKTSTQKVIIN